MGTNSMAELKIAEANVKGLVRSGKRLMKEVSTIESVDSDADAAKLCVLLAESVKISKAIGEEYKGHVSELYKRHKEATAKRSDSVLSAKAAEEEARIKLEEWGAGQLELAEAALASGEGISSLFPTVAGVSFASDTDIEVEDMKLFIRWCLDNDRPELLVPAEKKVKDFCAWEVPAGVKATTVCRVKVRTKK